jgi:hypothetical protein
MIIGSNVMVHSLLLSRDALVLGGVLDACRVVIDLGHAGQFRDLGQAVENLYDVPGVPDLVNDDHVERLGA